VERWSLRPSARSSARAQGGILFYFDQGGLYLGDIAPMSAPAAVPRRGGRRSKAKDATSIYYFDRPVVASPWAGGTATTLVFASQVSPRLRRSDAFTWEADIDRIPRAGGGRTMMGISRVNSTASPSSHASYWLGRWFPRAMASGAGREDWRAVEVSGAGGMARLDHPDDEAIYWVNNGNAGVCGVRPGSVMRLPRNACPDTPVCRPLPVITAFLVDKLLGPSAAGMNSPIQTGSLPGPARYRHAPPRPLHRNRVSSRPPSESDGIPIIQSSCLFRIHLAITRVAL